MPILLSYVNVKNWTERSCHKIIVVVTKVSLTDCDMDQS